MTIGRYTIYWRNGITYRLGRRWWYTPSKGSINGLLILGRIGVRWREHKPIKHHSTQVIPKQYDGMPWDSNDNGKKRMDRMWPKE